MAFARSLEPSSRSSYEDGNVKKCPADMLPQTEQERQNLWERYKEVGGDYGLIDIKAKQSKKTSRKRKRPRVWTFIKDVRDKICGGNQARADAMIANLRKRGPPKYSRHHPDMDSDDDNAEQVKCLEEDVEESGSESLSEMEATTKRQMSGDANVVRQDLKKLMTSSAKGQAKAAEPVTAPTPKAKSAAKGAAGGAAGKAKPAEGAKGAAGGAAGDESEASDDKAKREEAEKKKKAEEIGRKKNEPIEKNKSFLLGCPRILSEMEVLLRDLGSKKIKAVCPAAMVAEYLDQLKTHKIKMLEFRDLGERLASIKDSKQFTRKDTHTEAATKQMNDCRRGIKAAKAMLHVYLHEPTRN